MARRERTGSAGRCCGGVCGNSRVDRSADQRGSSGPGSRARGNLETKGNYAGNAGLDLSAVFTGDIDGTARTRTWDMAPAKDIDGVARTDTWDIGADEGVSGTAMLRPKVVTWREVDPQ